MAKHRSGAVGDVKLRFVSRFARFENWDSGHLQVQQALSRGPISSKMNDKIKEQQAGGSDPFASANGGGSPFDNPDTNFKFGPSGFDAPMPDLSPDPGDMEVPF